MFSIMQKTKIMHWLVILAMFVFPGAVSAAQEKTLQGFEVVGTGEHGMEGSQSVIKYYFMLECPFCMELNPIMTDWAKSLPDQYKLKFIPVVDDIHHQNAAKAIEAFSLLKPKLRKKYILNLFKAIQRQGQASQGWGVYAKEAQKLGVDLKQMKELIKSDEIHQVVRGHYKDMLKYKIQGSPMFVVSDKFKTSLGHVGGDSNLLIQILNGLVSQDYRARGFKY